MGNIIGVAGDVIGAPVAPVAPASRVPPHEWRVVAIISRRRIGGREGEDILHRVDEGTVITGVVGSNEALLLA